MSTLYVYLFAAALCLEACALVALWRWVVRRRTAAEGELHTASYNMGLRDVGEILRDIRVECGIAPGANAMLEEAFDRIRKAYK